MKLKFRSNKNQIYFKNINNKNHILRRLSILYCTILVIIEHKNKMTNSVLPSLVTNSKIIFSKNNIAIR